MPVYERPDSPYWWYLIPREDAKPIRKSTGVPIDAPTAELRKTQRALAERMYHERLIEIRDGKEDDDKPTITLTKHLDWYEKNVSVHKAGFDREQEIIVQLKQDLGSLSLTELARHRVAEWVTARSANVSKGTVKREFDLLRHALSMAVPKYLKKNPLLAKKHGRGKDATRIRVPNTMIRVLERRDERKLLLALPLIGRVLLTLGLDTLQRLNSLLALKWEHDKGRYLIFLDTKNGKEIRVPLSKRARKGLNQLKKKEAESEYIFAHFRKAKRQRDWRGAVRLMLIRACKRANVTYGRKNGITFHASTRHTGTSRMLEQGANIRAVQDIGGWADIRMLTKYGHPSDREKQRAVELVGRRK